MAALIYLDYAATTPPHPQVRQAMLGALDEAWGNPSSMHWAGRAARALVDEARAAVAAALGAPPEAICFTSGATEANNLALLGALRRRGRGHLITTAIEHHAGLHAAQQLEREGYSVTYLPVDGQGRVDPGDVRRALRPDTALISVMFVNNETGAIQPVAEIGRLAREHGVLFHTDAVQALGLLDVDVDALGADLVSLSAHKLYGPKGIGALYIRPGIELAAIGYGGAQERQRRPGTENVPGIVGLGTAVALAQAAKPAERRRLAALRAQLAAGLLARFRGARLNGPADPAAAAPHILSVSFPETDGEMLLFRLNAAGVAASLGSACTSTSIEPSHVLTAMGLPVEQIEGTLRLSLGRLTTAAEIDAVLACLPDAVGACRLAQA